MCHSFRASLLPRALLVLCLVQVRAGAADVVVGATREGDVLRIEASADFEGSLAQTWQVLTDYDNLASFIPNLTVSRVIARARDRITLEQKGEARLLFLSYPIEVRLVVTELPQTRVVSRAVAGNFREMSGTYIVEASGSRVKLRYSGRLVPAFYVPPLIGTWVLRNNVEETFSALVDEIVRRQNAAPPRGDPATTER